jgi:hypothetical protein
MHPGETMNDKLPFNPTADVSDQDKAHTPDKLRNDKALRKDRDMPEQERNADPAITSGRTTATATSDPKSSLRVETAVPDSHGSITGIGRGLTGESCTMVPRSGFP